MLTSTPVDVGAVVRQRRIDLSMSQTELAEKVGTTRQWISRFEKGTADVTLSRALAILRELDMTVDLRPRVRKAGTIIPAETLARINESIAASLPIEFPESVKQQMARRSAEILAPVRESADRQGSQVTKPIRDVLEANAAALAARLTDSPRSIAERPEEEDR